MVEIKVKVQIDAPIEKVWDIVSRVDDDPKFWTLTKSVRNISKETKEIVREVIVGKVDKCLQKVTLLPKEAVHLVWKKGVITGTKDIVLTPLGDRTLLEAKMSYNISGLARFFPQRIAEELQIEAEVALDLIKERVEGKPYLPMVERKLWADLIRG